jgi:polyhydroxyalkanoate synthesis regulator phasin
MNENEAKQFVADLMAGSHNRGNTERERQMMRLLFEIGSGDE